MSWYDDYWHGLKVGINAAWPEIAAGGISQDTSSERKDWINMLNDGSLVLPFCVIKLTITPSDDAPCDWPGYNVSAEINYIAPTRLPAGVSQTTATEYIMDRLVVLGQVLRQSGLIGTVQTDMPFSINADDPVNVGLLGAKISYQSGAITVTTLMIDGGT